MASAISEMCDSVRPGAAATVANLGSGTSTKYPGDAGVTERDDATGDDVLEDQTNDREELTSGVLRPMFTTLVHL